ncbi:MAG TPA: metalloregulator ArsR/SmtB family transcription factor, partial [Rhodothermales bacterium]
FESKTAAFSAEMAELAAFSRALGHPARLRIVQMLAERGTCICGEVVDALPLSQASVSRHLKLLKEAGIIRGEIDGARSCYCLDSARLERLRAEMTSYLSNLAIPTETPDCC